MSYQEIPGQLSIPSVDELMEGAERKKRLDELAQRVAEQEALAEEVILQGPPDPVYSEEEKVHRARESWEYNKMTQDLQGEAPPNWIPVAGMASWRPVGVWQADQDTALEDEDLRRRVQDGLADVVSHAAWEGRSDKVKDFESDLRELLGRYEALFALAEQVAKVSPIDRNGVYRSQRPKENIPGTKRMQ